MKLQAPDFLTFCFLLATLLSAEFGYCQTAIENLIVETYYVSDANDATDEDGGLLPEGAVTYRIFLDLAIDVEVTQIFSSANHTWFIQSTELIWNNEDRGETLGNQIGDNRLDDNTVALDSYITFGAASDAHFGIPKDLDMDGSIVGGENSDGGSEGIEEGLLINSTPEMGIPITEADGLIEVDESLIPTLDANILSNLNSVFQDEVNASAYSTNTETLQFPQGVSGVTDENIIMIAQITTLGDLEFNFNVEVRNAQGDLVRYVAENPQGNEVLSPYLSFPPECGCTDPDFLEYDPAAPCDDGSCETLIVFGCTDPEACNYNPDANFPPTDDFCCYGIDDCNGLDWTIICPQLSAEEVKLDFGITAYPNPTRDRAWLEITSDRTRDAELFIYDLQGKVVHHEGVRIHSGTEGISIPAQRLQAGMYLVRILDGEIDETTLLIKN